MTAFDQLHPVIQHHIVNTLEWPDLRALQAESVDPVLRGDDALLLAPTAGGKTEAAMFPLLSRMEREGWRGLSVLYVCPLKALLNNLEPRLATYAGWLGRAALVRHGDTTAGARRRQQVERPSVLLTTPESLEAMLVSRQVDAVSFFADLRAVVVDEVHAFAGDDRGWHLLAVLERVAALAGQPLQRIGLSATVGNPVELLKWLQGRGSGSRPASVVAPAVEGAAAPELALDYVGNVSNAAQVVGALHGGEKRLVFADSRRTVESLAGRLGDLGVETFVSHSSLSVVERRRAETAFAESRNCVIVSTSTLELGIDVGDLDRVLQVGAPASVASLLQRLGRTGRRPGTSRNLTFLATTDDELLRAAALLLLHSESFVEPITPPPRPLHIASQQLLGLALQKGHVSMGGEAEWLAELRLGTRDELGTVGDWLLQSGHLDSDSGLAFVGPEAERRYGARNFMDLLAVFTAAPEVTVLHGRQEVGSVDPMTLTTKTDGPRIIGLAGRSWEVTHIDWRRRRAFVEPSSAAGRSRWPGAARAYSFELCDAIRRVLLGASLPEVALSQRTRERLKRLRDEQGHTVAASHTVIAEANGRLRWWTYAGSRANAVLMSALDQVRPELLDGWSPANLAVTLRHDATAVALREALAEATRRFGEDLSGVEPPVDAQAVKRLKFADLLPPEMAARTLASRSADPGAARVVAVRPMVQVR